MTTATTLAIRLHDPLTHALIQALGWTLLHFLWQGALIAAALWCVLALTRGKSAEGRYIAACITLLSMLVLPALTFVRLTESEYRLAVQHASATIDGGLFVLNVGADGTPIPWFPWLTARLDQAMLWVMAAWGAGVLLFSCRLALGMRVVRRLKLAGTEQVSAELQRVFESVRMRLAVTRTVRLAHCARIHAPAVIGWLKPVVLVPAACLAGMSPQQVEALVAHELGHVLRHDYVISVFQSVVETVLFYHPAVWWVSRQVRSEREYCCDKLAVRVSGDRLAYARALSLLEERRAQLPELALGANGGVLTMRIKRLLGCTEELAPANVAWVLVVMVVIAGSAGILGRLAYAQANAMTDQMAVANSSPAQDQNGRSAAAAQPKSPLRVSAEKMTGQVISRIDPIYPADAKAAGTQGTVVLHVIVGKDGTVRNVQEIGGPQELLKSAIDAVSQWKYKPYLLNGQPVDVDTTINVNYSLTGDTQGSKPGPQASTAPAPLGSSVPVVVHKVQAEYTQQARTAKVQGAVVVELVVDKQGHPENVHVVKSLDPGLDRNAIAAVEQYEFRPAFEDGKPVDRSVKVEVQYRVF